MRRDQIGFWVPGSDRVTYQAFMERNRGREELTMRPVSERKVSPSQRRCKPRQEKNGRELRAVGRWDLVVKRNPGMVEEGLTE